MRRASLAGVLDLVLGLGEDLAEHALLGAETAQRFDVVDLEFGALERAHDRPAEAGGHADFAVIGRATVFVGHLEEDEVGELFEVVAVAHAVVTEGVTERPDFGDDAVGGHVFVFRGLNSPLYVRSKKLLPRLRRISKLPSLASHEALQGDAMNAEFAANVGNIQRTSGTAFFGGGRFLSDYDAVSHLRQGDHVGIGFIELRLGVE
jgi:hypothetical protein